MSKILPGDVTTREVLREPLPSPAGAAKAPLTDSLDSETMLLLIQMNPTDSFRTSTLAHYLYMFELPRNVAIFDVKSGEIVDATIVRLTRDMAKKRIDAEWWDIGGSRSLRKQEADHKWRWVEILGENSKSGFAETLALLTSDNCVQAAVSYHVDGESLNEANAGAIFVEYFAAAPRNRNWLVENPAFRGTGTALLLNVVLHSYQLGLKGRVVLVSVPTDKAKEFYQNRGFNMVAEIDSGMIEYELAEESAKAWLRAEGLIK